MLTTLCHMASQSTHRWYPGPRPPSVCEGYGSANPFPPDQDSEPQVRLPLIADAEWLAFIAKIVKEGDSRVPWMRDYFEKLDPNGDLLFKITRKHLTYVREASCQYISLWDPIYPPALRSLDDPPLGLTLRGNSELLVMPMVSVIGSRKGSGLAVQQSFRLGNLLAQQGIVTVSGGAFGCDIAAHHGVLAAGLCPARAIGVFAGGLHQLYPKGNGGIFRSLEAQGGLFVSERLWWAPARRHDFPVRNRLISGLSGVTFVMQAGKPSGAFITAKMALDQGRDVAVLRHPDLDVRAAGTRALLEDGAQDYEDVAEFVASIVETGRWSQGVKS